MHSFVERFLGCNQLRVLVERPKQRFERPATQTKCGDDDVRVDDYSESPCDRVVDIVFGHASLFEPSSRLFSECPEFRLPVSVLEILRCSETNGEIREGHHPRFSRPKRPGVAIAGVNSPFSSVISTVALIDRSYASGPVTDYRAFRSSVPWTAVVSDHVLEAVALWTEDDSLPRRLGRIACETATDHSRRSRQYTVVGPAANRSRETRALAELLYPWRTCARLWEYTSMM